VPRRGGSFSKLIEDTDFRSKHAYWVAEIFGRFGITQSVIHVRQLHYRLISQKTPIPQVDGTPYVNSGDCYNRLCDAIKDARYLDLMSSDVLIDRRNPSLKRLGNFVFSSTRFSSPIGVPMKRIEATHLSRPTGESDSAPGVPVLLVARIAELHLPFPWRPSRGG
jgi:hypothetical protein